MQLILLSSVPFCSYNIIYFYNIKYFFSIFFLIIISLTKVYEDDGENKRTERCHLNDIIFLTIFNESHLKTLRSKHLSKHLN